MRNTVVLIAQRLFVRLLYAGFFFLGLAYIAQDVLIFPALLTKFDPRFKEILTEIPDNVVAFEINTVDNKKLHVWKVAAKPLYAHFPQAAIMFHGNGEILQTSFPMQEALRKLGITSYAFDYRGIGLSEGWPSELGIYADARTLWDFVTLQEFIPPERVLLIGVSLGSGPAAMLAAEKKAAQLALLAPYTSIPDVMRDKGPPLAWFRALARHVFPVKFFLSKLDKTCVLAFHSKKDEVIPYSHSKRLQTLAPNPKKFSLFLYEEGNHMTLPDLWSDLVNGLNSCAE